MERTRGADLLEQFDSRDSKGTFVRQLRPLGKICCSKSSWHPEAPLDVQTTTAGIRIQLIAARIERIGRTAERDLGTGPKCF